MEAKTKIPVHKSRMNDKHLMVLIRKLELLIAAFQDDSTNKDFLFSDLNRSKRLEA